MREDRLASTMVLTVTEDTPADMLAGSMELLVQLPRDNFVTTQRVTVQRSTPMMDLLVQIATAHKLAASCYTLQVIGERGLVLPHQPNTPIGALDALQVKLLPKQGTLQSRKTRQISQPFETTFRLQVHLPRNQLYVSRVSPKTNLRDILEQVCREKNLEVQKYELRHPGDLEQVLDLSLSLQDYHLQEVTLYVKHGRSVGAALSSQDIMVLQKQEDRRRQQARKSVFSCMFRTKSKESHKEVPPTSPTRSEESQKSIGSMQPPTRPIRKRKPAPKPPTFVDKKDEEVKENSGEGGTVKKATVISHSRNSSDSSGYHEASVLSDNLETSGRTPDGSSTLPWRNKHQASSSNSLESPSKLARMSQASKSLCNLAAIPAGELTHAHSSTSLSSNGQRKKRAAPAPPTSKTLPSAITNLERIVDSEELVTSDMDLSKPASDVGTSKDNSEIAGPVANIDKTEAPSMPLAEANVESSRVVRRDDKPMETQLLLQKVSDSLKTSAAIPPPPSPTFPEQISLETVEKPVDEIDAPQKVDVVQTEVLEKCLEKVPEELPESPPEEVPEKPLEKLQEHPGLFVQEMSLEKPPVDGTVEDSFDKSPEKSLDTCQDEISPISMSFSEEASPEVSAVLQQDTSDYVSAIEDDSVAYWDYDIPAPPSEFRDNFHEQEETNVNVSQANPVEKQIVTDEIPLNEVENEVTDVAAEKLSRYTQEAPMKVTEKFSETVEEEIPTPVEVILKNEGEKVTMNGELTRKTEELPTKSEDKVSRTAIIPTQVKVPEKKETVTHKLETKSEQRRPVEKKSLDVISEANVAPSDNPLSNFKITTYSAPKELDIFGNSEPSRVYSRGATLPRKLQSNKNTWTDVVSVEERKKEEKGVYRSKSYVTLANVEKFKENVEKREQLEPKKVEGAAEKKDGAEVKKFSSIVNLNQENEKFADWREQSLKRNESTSEKQLRSLQVLKSILPQLQNVKSDGASVEPKAPPTEEASKKRYSYSGAPSVSLGSWSERPSVNVQIKMDSDYKFSQTKGTGGKTIVNLNSAPYKKNAIQENTSLTAHKVLRNGVNEPKPNVTTVELNKSATIDTRSRNFNELAKTFNQFDVPRRNKTATLQNRHSIDVARIESWESEKEGNLNLVGNLNRVKLNLNKTSVPLFKNSTVVPIKHEENGEKIVSKVVDKPVITGVTLKNSTRRSVSPPKVDVRESLLESIRNFGGKGNLRNVGGAV